MTPDEITNTLTALFGENINVQPPNIWQIQTSDVNLLILLSEDQTWLRALIPIASQQEAENFLPELLAANFDLTLETRYALHQDVLWAVFHHSINSLTPETLTNALATLLSLEEQGISGFWNQILEQRIREIIKVAKLQGQSKEVTLQTLDHLYTEGVLGDLNNPPEERQQTLDAWRHQLDRLWNEVEP